MKSDYFYFHSQGKQREIRCEHCSAVLFAQKVSDSYVAHYKFVEFDFSPETCERLIEVHFRYYPECLFQSIHTE